MKDTDFKTIYNIPEEISGLGYKANLLGISLYIALFICAIPCILIDKKFIKEFIEITIQSGTFIILGISFIFILCPLYFFIRFIIETIRTIKKRHEFYSTPNIKYIKLNDDNIFFKNTFDNNDFSLNKSDITKVWLTGKVKSFTASTAKGSPKTYTYIENLVLSITTDNDNYSIYPIIYGEETLLKQIEFYKNYFNNDKFYVLFGAEGIGNVNKLKSFEIAHMLETGKKEKETKTDKLVKYSNLILKIVVLISFISYVIFLIRS